ncbi:MAG TPA: (E)-4-hydroxy-3-methylbut-2-enyl-diphosphate synthase [Chloroflexota bacterium]|nr:(E)-4-hydroxy-3-methylbut-2-enyl-diphosphate synthase [Chloroflexota bacterium]
MTLSYAPDLYNYRRRPTRVVMVGDVGVGADNPIRVQSMTTTLTKDVDATVDQVARLVAAGCEIVRITTPTPSDARCLGPIKERLAARGIRVPIVADIHFNPAAALAAADYADKVRVNPGNYADSRSFKVREYSDEEYAAELARVEERFTPLVLKCKERGIAMRIGTNHGSLSDRIMNRFGDTPEGMVESALEFARICRKHDYHDIIFSMKASNPRVMIAAYRLLAARLDELGWDYPFHLGVTEAGNGEDGRIKSAIGIGSLLEDGIGDTIRVSLTEEPEAEIPVADALAARYGGRRDRAGDDPGAPWDLYHYTRRPSRETPLGDLCLGGTETIAVIAPLDGSLSERADAMASILRWASPGGRRQPKPDAALLTLSGHADVDALGRIRERLRKWPQAALTLIGRGDPAFLQRAASDLDAVILPATADPSAYDLPIIAEGTGGDLDPLLDIAGRAAAVTLDGGTIADYRRLVRGLAERNLTVPILLAATADHDEPYLSPAITLGSLLCDGIGDAVLITGAPDSTSLAFNVLQAAGARLTKTDYVACPSCGRTLFDLQETTERIKRRTSHLVGVKLAIMGCIVNGPGEMADADFGYVGGAPGQVNLYVGKECVEKGVPAAEADDRLIALIKERGKWQEEEAVPAGNA